MRQRVKDLVILSTRLSPISYTTALTAVIKQTTIGRIVVIQPKRISPPVSNMDKNPCVKSVNASIPIPLSTQLQSYFFAQQGHHASYTTDIRKQNVHLFGAYNA